MLPCRNSLQEKELATSIAKPKSAKRLMERSSNARKLDHVVPLENSGSTDARKLSGKDREELRRELFDYAVNELKIPEERAKIYSEVFSAAH